MNPIKRTDDTFNSSVHPQMCRELIVSEIRHNELTTTEWSLKSSESLGKEVNEEK